MFLELGVLERVRVHVAAGKRCGHQVECIAIELIDGDEATADGEHCVEFLGLNCAGYSLSVIRCILRRHAYQACQYVVCLVTTGR